MTTEAKVIQKTKPTTVSNAQTSVGVDIRENTITVATIKYTQRKRTVTQIGHYRINGISENGILRGGNTVTEIIQNIMNANKNARVNIIVGAARKSTLYATEDYKSLTQNQITKAIPTQAPKFFTNHQELTLASAPAYIRKRRRLDNHWVIVGTPSANVRLIREAGKSTRANIIAIEPKAISVLRITPDLTDEETHIIINGGDDGTEITVIEDGRISLIRSIPRSSTTDIEPEIARVIDYLRNQTETPITTHLLTHQTLKENLAAYGVKVRTPSITDAIDTSTSIPDDDLAGAFTAVSLALAAVPASGIAAHYPNVDFLHAGKRSKAARAGGPSPAFFPIVSAIALAGAAGYHVITNNQINNLRNEVRTLRETVLTGSATEEQRIAESIERQIENQRAYLNAHDFAENERTQPTSDIATILSAMPNVATEDRTKATRFSDLTITYERNQLFIPPGESFARVNVTFVSPDLQAIETDMNGLETHEQLRPSLRTVSRPQSNQEGFAGTMNLTIIKPTRATTPTSTETPPDTTTEPAAPDITESNPDTTTQPNLTDNPTETDTSTDDPTAPNPAPEETNEPTPTDDPPAPDTTAPEPLIIIEPDAITIEIEMQSDPPNENTPEETP